MSLLVGIPISFNDQLRFVVPSNDFVEFPIVIFLDVFNLIAESAAPPAEEDAVQVFDIDLKAWLDSTNNDFIHDYVGIYKNIDRDAISSKHFASKNDFGTFVPRFARNENNLIKDCYESYKNLLKLEKKIHESAILFQTVALTLAEMQQKYEDGIEVKRQGDDADDEILCPECGYSLARNDEEEELRPKHCPECGIKLIY